jgi:hypothetical protein
MAGYSVTPLARKLGIKPGDNVLTIGAPTDYRAWLVPLPEGASFIAKAKPSECAIVHLFAPMMTELERHLPAARRAMTRDGALWVSWYKQSAKIPTDVTENLIRDRLLQTDLVDVKVCAVSDQWSGLKFVIRKALR